MKKYIKFYVLIIILISIFLIYKTLNIKNNNNSKIDNIGINVDNSTDNEQSIKEDLYQKLVDINHKPDFANLTINTFKKINTETILLFSFNSKDSNYLGIAELDDTDTLLINDIIKINQNQNENIKIINLQQQENNITCIIGYINDPKVNMLNIIFKNNDMESIFLSDKYFLNILESGLSLKYLQLLDTNFNELYNISIDDEGIIT